MKTDLPVEERTLPPESADRIRSAIMADEPETLDLVPSRTWLLPIAAVLVVIALLAAAAALWPRTSSTEVTATPSPVQPTWTPTTVVQSRPPFYKPTPPVGRAPATPTTGPTGSEPFLTDRGPLSAEEEAAVVEFCDGDVGGNGEGSVGLHVRRVTNGQEDMIVAFIRDLDDKEWVCIPDALLVPLEPVSRSVGPNPENPVVTRGGSAGQDRRGVTEEWTVRALPSVQRIQIRAVVDDKPQPWFEAHVHGGLAYLPMFTPGTFTWNKTTGTAVGISYEHRAFDIDGQEVPVKVVQPKKR